MINISTLLSRWSVPGIFEGISELTTFNTADFTIPVHTAVIILQVAADTLTSLLISVQILCGSYLPVVHEVQSDNQALHSLFESAPNVCPYRK